MKDSNNIQYKDKSGLDPAYVESYDELIKTLQVLNWILRFHEKIEDMPEEDIIKEYEHCLLHHAYKRVLDHNRQEWTIETIDEDMKKASWIISNMGFAISEDFINHAIRAKEKIEKLIRGYDKRKLQLIVNNTGNKEEG